MEDLPILDAQPPTQDGGNSSELREDSSWTRKERSLRFRTRILTLTLKTETSKLQIEVTTLDNNGRSCTLTSTLSQRRESLTSNSDCLLREISTSSQLCQVEDTSIWSTTETWSSRLQTEERLKSGTSRLESKTIRTRYNNQSWDIKSAGRTRDMQIWSTNSGWFQVFQF